MTITIQDDKSAAAPNVKAPLENKTMVLTRTTREKIIGPRLVCTIGCGESKIFPLEKIKLVIGRSVEADLNLLDPLVSRKHCVIQKTRQQVFR